MPVYQCPVTGSYAPISHLDIEKLDWEIKSLKKEIKRLKKENSKQNKQIIILKALNIFFK